MGNDTVEVLRSSNLFDNIREEAFEQVITAAHPAATQSLSDNATTTYLHPGMRS